MISSDASQIGFVGIPLLFIGVIVGLLIGASKTDYSGRVMLGALAGFFVGLAGGVALDVAAGAAVVMISSLRLQWWPAARWPPGGANTITVRPRLRNNTDGRRPAHGRLSSR